MKRESSGKAGRPPKLQVITEAQLAGMLPLDYMLAVIRDPNASQSRRDRMAAIAAPYCHARLTEAAPKGKKELQAEAAVSAGVLSEWSGDLQIEDRAN